MIETPMMHASTAQHLVDAEANAHDRFDEIAVDPVEQHHDRGDREHCRLDDRPRPRPRHRRVACWRGGRSGRTETCVRIMRFTAVFLALMTPSTFRKGWCEPPMAASSSRVAMIVCGVAHTIQPMTRTRSIHFVYGAKRSAPGMRPIPVHR